MPQSVTRHRLELVHVIAVTGADIGKAKPRSFSSAMAISLFTVSLTLSIDPSTS